MRMELPCTVSTRVPPDAERPMRRLVVILAASRLSGHCGLPVTRPQWIITRRVNLSVRTSPWPNDQHPLPSERSSRRWSLRKESLSYVAKKISSGVVHEMPADLKKALTSDPQALTAWEDITRLARNEWICWIESAKRPETRSLRIE
jgi:hypothetical protein